MSWKPFAAALAFTALSAVAAVPLHAQSCTASTATGSSSWVGKPGTTPPSTVPGNESNHCDFAQFSWQSFLSLMQVGDTGTGQLVFETYMDTDGMFPASGSPTPWGQEPWPLTLTEITQAGSGFGLYAQNKSQVYYDMSVNQTMYNYVNTNMLYNATCFNAGVTAKDIHMPPTVSTDTSDESIELKTAWLPMTSCNPKQYHCITALINGQKSTVGLIGIHIVHKLPDHQEWIWSTFEHVDNAPDCTQVTNPPAGYSNWNFFKPGFVATGSACPACNNDGTSCSALTQCNVNVSEPQLPNICRVTPLATVTCNSGDTNLNDDPNNTACLNASVQNILGSGSVWSNYQLVGTIWFKPGMSAPDSSGQTPPSGQSIVGNLPTGGSTQMLANSAMETYTQAPDVDPNCFSCHTNTFKAYSASSAETSGHADFSHIFNRILETNTVTCPTITTQASHGTGTKKTEATAYAPAPKPASSHGQNKH
jgi:hypothetical protein